MSLPIYQNKPPEKSLDHVKNIVGVAAGKGGVGKSTLSVNLALALQRLGFKVGILDSDLYGPSIRQILPEQTPPSQKGEWLMPAICHGIRVISMAYFRHAGEATVVRAPIANNVINQFVHKVHWGALDYLFIDFPPGTGDIQLTLCQQASITGMVVVTTPQQVALIDVEKAMHMCDQVQVPILGIVENMSGYYNPQTQERIPIFGSNGGRKLAERSGIPFLGEIPIDPEICECGDRGIPLIPQEGELQAKPSVKALMAIAASLPSEIDALKAYSQETLQQFELKWKKM